MPFFVAAQGATKPVAPVRRRECSLNIPDGSASPLRQKTITRSFVPTQISTEPLVFSRSGNGLERLSADCAPTLSNELRARNRLC